MMSRAHIHFYSRKRLLDWPDIEQRKAANISQFQQRLRSGIDVWTIQTYIMVAPSLRELGFEVTIGMQIPPKSILVAHRDDLNYFCNGAHRAFIVGIRADRSTTDIADIEIHENPLHLQKANQYHVPLWPQPGLIPRASERGNQIATLTYYGRTDSLPAWLFNTEFINELKRLGVELMLCQNEWHDYRHTDLVLAYRVESATMLEYKPATKLYNAWQAGVPALVMPEPALLDLQRSELDFFIVRSAKDIIAAITRLKNEAGLYEAMSAHGRVRGQDFSAEKIAERWIKLFDAEIAQAHQLWLKQPRSPLSWLTYAALLIKQKRAAARFKQIYLKELAELRKKEPLASKEQIHQAIKK